MKELDLSEGRATGIPTIQKHLRLNGSSPAVIETDSDRTYFLMIIPCRKGFDSTDSNIVDISDTIGLAKLEQALGQMYGQVKKIVNQCDMSDKVRLGQILGQMYVQVWSKSRSKSHVYDFVSDTIDTLCLLKNEDLSANALNKAIKFGATKDLKRKILIPLIELGYIAMTNPNKPTSSKQTYRLTDIGITLF